MNFAFKEEIIFKFRFLKHIIPELFISHKLTRCCDKHVQKKETTIHKIIAVCNF